MRQVMNSLIVVTLAATICLGKETKKLDEILFAGWGPHNRDSLYYLPSQATKVQFDRYWKFKDLKEYLPLADSLMTY
jgi:hypothetical protein